jgi:signal-transduction protein with cAMP-binding, CBS, and nucleotidyltransferase domain/DNA polymerase III epsilon subunit-like protein
MSATSATLPPPNLTALAALPVAVLDLETTGLDVRRDRVVQIGAVAMLGPRILDAPRIEQLVNPGVPMPAVAERIHGLGDADVAAAPDFASVYETLHEMISGRVVVGHNVAFDLAVLRHEAARAGLIWHDPPALDIAQLIGALEPALPDLGLETIASDFDVHIEHRHSALGDSMAAAQVFARLIPRLREADVRTLGEAQLLAAKRDDLVRRQAEAGWYAVPGEAPPARPTLPVARIDSYLYERRLKDLMGRPPLFIPGDATLRTAIREMHAHRVGAVLVGQMEKPPEGILTERDVLRESAAATLDFDRTPVREVMTSPVETMAGDELVYRALGRMDRLGFRHLCVVDARGIAIGVVSQRDVLHHRVSAAMVLGDALQAAEDAVSMAASHGQVPEVARRLVAEGMGGTEVAGVVSHEVRALTARASELTLARMAAEGRGAPPAAWCVLVLGSGGRGESLLVADQDNAIVHAGGPQDDAWFAELGAGIAALLDEAGIPRCQGGVMGANAEWRGTLADWHARLDGWLQRAKPDDLMNIDIFFDLMPVAGDAQLGHRLHADAVAAASRTPPFLALLAEWVDRLRPPLGMFGSLRSKEGRVDLKRGGLMPIVSIARTLALRVGSTARATPDRLRDAAAAGRLAESDATTLASIHADLMTRVLRQQLIDLEAGVRPSSRVAVNGQPRNAVRSLARQLRTLDEIMNGLRGAIAA